MIAGGIQAIIQVVTIVSGFETPARFVRGSDHERDCDSSTMALKRDSGTHRASRAEGSLADLAHDLRTPLTAIRGFAELMLTGAPGPVSEEQREYLDAIFLSAGEMLGVLQDVADLEAIEAGTLVLRPEDVDALATAREVSERFRGEARDRDLVLVVSDQPPIPAVVADKARLSQILSAFVGYAVKASPRQGRVSVQVASSGRRFFRLDVHASAIGNFRFPSANPFNSGAPQVSGASGPYRGPGLGLPFAKRIAEACGGRVGITRPVSGGTTLSVVLPRRISVRLPADIRLCP